MPAGEGVQPRIQSRRPFPRITPARRHGQFTPAEKAQAATADNLFADSIITYTAGDRESYSFECTGTAVAMGVVSVTDRYTGTVYTPVLSGQPWATDPELLANQYIVRYVEDKNHNKVLDEGDVRLAQDAIPSAVGNYFVIAMNNSAAGRYPTGTGNLTDNFIDGSGYVAQYFEITARSLEDAEAVYVLDADEGSYSTELTYDTTDQMNKVGFVLDGELLDADSYDVRFDKAEIKDAGEYTATLTGKGLYKGSEATVKFTVKQLDLATAVKFSNDIKAENSAGLEAAANAYVVSGSASLTFKGLMDAGDIAWTSTEDSGWKQVRYHGTDGISYGETASGYQTWDKANAKLAGGYEFYAKAATKTAGAQNVVGECYVTVDVVTKLITADKFLYDNVVMNDNTPTVHDGELNGALFELAKGDSYASSKFSISGEKDAKFTVSLSDEEGNAVGTHNVVVEITNPGDYSVGGSSHATFTVVQGVINTAKVEAVAIVDGVNVEFGKTAKVTYDGEPVVPAITLTCSGKTLVQGTDYTVTYTDAAGKVVEEMRNAGTYTVTIASDTYRIDGAKSFTVAIAQRAFDRVFVQEPVEAADGTEGILYTGSEIEPVLVGIYTVGAGTNAEERTVTLDPSWYLLSGMQFRADGADGYLPTTEVLGVGDYKVNVSPTDACINFSWDPRNGAEFSVVDTAYFTDVDASEWYAGEVNDAAFQGYIKGVGDTKLFMPENDINRAELAQVLFNMAGKSVDPNKTYPTPFSDVAADAWFAQPVAWAYSAGVVTGMGDTGTYAPFENATREQVAAMFYRYAKAQGMDVSGGADLSGYADEAAVSGWAADAVAWAVEAGVFGQGTETLRPSDPISRAEVAAMAIRLQPEALNSADDVQIGA